ncbi:MAG: Nramp family divalent metal transporter [bacterium]|nr:Nramp family divalent metal transporter [bacterium]
MTEPHDRPHPENAGDGSDLDLDAVRQGLRMQTPPDPEQLAAEARHLEELDRGPFGRRLFGWIRLSGPGYLQAAMTLGAGTAVSALFAGSVFGYRMLWVAPVGMLIGVIVFAALAHQTLSTGERPLVAMARHAGRPFAIAWAIGAMLASVIWHLPQYNLAASSTVDLLEVAGADGVPQISASLGLAVVAVALSWNYGRSPALIRIYERVIKYMIWSVVLCMGWVVLRTDTDWGAVVRGFCMFELPAEKNGVSSTTLAVGGLAAAVGINMVFLYPYSLLARGWGRSHRGLARCDLVLGTLVPYVLAASLMAIAAANTLHESGDPITKKTAVAQMGTVLGDVLGPITGRVIFDVGVLGMTFSTIALHMLVCGFVAMEWFDLEIGSFKQRLWTLLPVPACLAPLFWGDYAVWLAVPTSILCGAFLPLTYIGILILQRSRRYLGKDRPTGVQGMLWTIGLLLATTIVVVALVSYLIGQFG